MINIGAGAASIINDTINNPMSRGIGASIKQTKVSQSTKTWKPTQAVIQGKPAQKKNTLASVLSNIGESVESIGTSITGTVQIPFDEFATVGGGFGGAFGQGIKSSSNSTVSSSDLKDILTSSAPAQRLSQELFGNQSNYISNLVNEMLDATVSKKLQDEIKKGRLSLQTSKLGKTYATAVAYYKKLYDGSLIMTQLRNKTEKKIADLINKKINGKLSSLNERLGDFGKILLSKSKLASSLRAIVNKEVHTVITSLVSDKMISGINDALLGNLKKIRDSISATFNEQFKTQIEKVVQLRSLVEKKIVEFMQLKQQYEKKIAEAIQSLTNKIGEALQEATNKMISSIGDSVKTAVAGIKL